MLDYNYQAPLWAAFPTNHVDLSDPYARKLWPLLTGAADFWDHDLKLVNGRYVDQNDAEDEHLWGPADDINPATVIGFLNMLYPGADRHERAAEHGPGDARNLAR